MSSSQPTVTVEVGSIIKQADCDAIVNSANSNLRAGSGVCGAIHSAAGPALEEFSSRLAPLALSQAVFTPGFSLPNPWVIHVRGPKYLFDPSPAQALRACMHHVIELADRNELARIAVPAISTGVYGYPMDEAIPLLVDSAKAALKETRHIQEVRFIVTSAEIAYIFQGRIQDESTDPTSVLNRRLIEAIRDQFRLGWNGIHGVSHWSRVRLNGLDLAKTTGADPVVIELFAFLHDSCRHDDGHDAQHGPRAAEFVCSLQGRELWLSDQQFSLLQTACRGHSFDEPADDVTVATCWDADRLDLWRLDIRPDPARLMTDAARHPELLMQAQRRAETR
jgi:O-acetyl-ADP-ribose deacetylase (regulator of RNase III)